MRSERAAALPISRVPSKLRSCDQRTAALEGKNSRKACVKNHLRPKDCSRVISLPSLSQSNLDTYDMQRPARAAE